VLFRGKLRIYPEFFLYLRMKKIIVLALSLVVFFACHKKKVEETINSFTLLPPPDGKIYHNAYPDFNDTEDQVYKDSIIHFEAMAGKKLGWVYFSNNWLPEKGGIIFPSMEVEKIHALKRTPYIRMMARSKFEEGREDSLYNMDNFLNGMFDEDLKKWMRKASSYNFPLLVEFGTEMNGFWFPWNGYWNGGENTSFGNPGDFDGPEKFRKVYQKIINFSREEGAHNITWFFHVNVENDPVNQWNKMKFYYPGDEYIDWIGVSVYGSLEYMEPWRDLKEILSDNWDEITHISTTGKPIAVLEWGICDNPNLGNKGQWITKAVHSFTSGAVYSKEIKAISYWNEAWEDNSHLINLRIDSSPESLEAYKNAIKSPIFISELQFEE